MAHDVSASVSRLLDEARARGIRIATAESCTGGMVAAALTDMAGSSDVLDRGFVTYSNAAKADMLGVDPELIRQKGAVSAEVARAMALGALQHADAAVAVSITGIAGPGGGSAEKPVGLVFFASARRTTPGDVNAQVTVREERFGDIGRAAVRAQSVETALAMLLDAVLANSAAQTS